MGLDMYLTGQIYISKYDKKTARLRSALKKRFKKELTLETVKFEIMPNAYSRIFKVDVNLFTVLCDFG